jgi:DNA invertase Pin-like site-specific DNA recombinase
MEQKFIAYLRRSKKEQTSSLGLEAQQMDVEHYAKKENGVIVNTHVEIESGTRKKLDRRFVLMEAINECKEKNAILLIAKLDRLARDVEFTSRLMNSGVRFVACDMPRANEFTIHVMAAVAEQEAKRISERTKDALLAYRAKGGKLGYHAHKVKKVEPFDNNARKKALETIVDRRKANPNNRRAQSYVLTMRSKGMSYGQIAKKMNDEGFLSPSGTKIVATTVKRWLDYGLV